MTDRDTRPDQLSPLKQAILEIRDLRARLAAAEEARREPIAVIGLGCRFPGAASDAVSFWRLLVNGTDAIGPIPAERWSLDELYDPDPTRPGRMYTRHGGFLEQVDQFDPTFFGIAPREAVSMDPQQRLLLEVAWEALEHAGCAPDRLQGSRTGVFFGLSNGDYMRLLAERPEEIDVYFATGNNFSVAAGRLSYLLGLHGPSLVVDTACSASLTAVHLACQSLRSGESELALAGGVNLILAPEINITFSKAQMMAPDGRCKTFDAAADGYVRGEGCGVIVLKRLRDAQRDGDPILAVIRGSAVNQDGRSSGLTAPNGPAQEAVVRAALTAAGLTPAGIDYIEAHGTGTSLGDPIEVNALGAVFGPGRPAEQPLLIGSVKTNIGHTEAAAGIAGLIKVVLALQAEWLPPHLHLRTPNPLIDWEALPIAVPTTGQPWLRGERPRRAGVSSFGFSGTNAHVILEEAPAVAETERPTAPTGHRPLLTLSAQSSAALTTMVHRYVDYLAAAPPVPLVDLCLTTNLGRAGLSQRLAVSATSLAELRARLTTWLAGEATEGVWRSPSTPRTAALAFLCTGHGTQAVGMGRVLFETEPRFRDVLVECDRLLAPHLSRSLLSVLYPDPATAQGDEAALMATMTYGLASLFAVQLGLAAVWRHWGILPTLVAGHSAGEYAAACLAGVFSLADGLRLVVTRGHLLDSLPQRGAMAAVFTGATPVATAIAAVAPTVAIAALNGPANTVISGERDTVQAVLDHLTATGAEWRWLAIAQASHSPLVEPILDEFERVAAGITYHPPQLGYVSGRTGQLVEADSLTSPGYWRRHLRETVRFADAVTTLVDQGVDSFIEIGPQPVLTSLARSNAPDGFGVWLPSLRHDRDDWDQLAESLAMLYVNGRTPDWAAVAGTAGQRLALPTYPWQRQRYWLSGSRPPLAPVTTAETRWAQVERALLTQADQGPLDLDPLGHPARLDALNALASAYLTSALRRLGLFGTAGERWSAASIVAGRGVLPTYQPLIQRWLDQLIALGHLAAAGDGHAVCHQPLAEPPLAALETAAEGLADTMAPLLGYVRRSGALLAAIITGAESPLETLFPGGSTSVTAFLYRDWSVARYFNAMVRAVVEAIVQATPTAMLRVIEIGAGTGGTTASLLPILRAGRCRYHFTDVSSFFLHRAAEQFVDDPTLIFDLLDIERDPAAQGFTEHSYDVVVAANALHATRDLDATLQHVRRLLAPGGLLVLYETTAHPTWFDVTTGLIEGWEIFADRWRDGHPLLTAERWSLALQANGFEAVLAAPGPTSPTSVFGQHVLVARGPLAVSATVAPAQDERAAAPAVQATTVPGQVDPIGPALAAALPAERHDLLVSFIRSHVIGVLRLDPGQAPSRQGRLLDLGLDSLMAVELRQRLSQGLNLARPLPATLVFDHPSITAMALYLEQQLFAKAAPDPAASAPLTDTPTGSISAHELADLSDDDVEAMLLDKINRL